LRQREGSERIVGDRFEGMLLQQRYVFVGGGVEEELRSMGFQCLFKKWPVGCASQDEMAIRCGAVAGERGLQSIERLLGGVKED